MSINQFSTDLTQSVWWAQQQSFMEPNQNPASSFPLHLHHHHQDHPLEEEHKEKKNCYHNDKEGEGQFDDHKEAMFEKPLTPSDVGKLNRLVIPKQHAEKYFPLSGDSVDKGLLLSFEDELGKCWRFRYSYWNSSQSYVLTKGWSRYVKEKRLDAGDVVLFERHRFDGERLFIGWRRRGAGGDYSSGTMAHGNNGGVWSRESCSQQQHQIYELGHVSTGVPYQPNCLHAGSGGQNQTIGIGNSKRLRLFGVNLECHPEGSEPSTPDGSSMSRHHHVLCNSHSP